MTVVIGIPASAEDETRSPITGDVISGLPSPKPSPASGRGSTCKVFHAGTALDDVGNIIANGGRVLCVAALGESVGDAQRNAYAGVDAIHWASEFHRHDIGWRAIARERGDA